MSDENAQVPYVAPIGITGGFSSAEFADNPEPRCPCLLLLDTSGSMNGSPIQELNAGLQTFKDEVSADPLASKRVEVAVMTFGGTPTIVSDFVDANAFSPPTLVAGGLTPMGSAIIQAIDHLKARKDTYRQNGISYYRPWIFLITDGAPTDAYAQAASAVHAGEAAGQFTFYAVGIKDADLTKLAQIAPPNRPPLRLDGLRFRDLFQWLSKSMRTVAQSNPNAPVNLSAPGWITAPA